MKTKGEIVDAWIVKDSPNCTQTKRWQIMMLLDMYGAQVREEAAKIAEPHESGSYCTACGPDIATAIRKMELP